MSGSPFQIPDIQTGDMIMRDEKQLEEDPSTSFLEQTVECADPKEFLHYNVDDPIVDIIAYHGQGRENYTWQIFHIHAHLLCLHSPYYKKLVQDLALTQDWLHINVKPAIFKRVRDWMYSGSFALTSRLTNPAKMQSETERPGLSFTDRIDDNENEDAEIQGTEAGPDLPKSPFEEQKAVADIWEFAVGAEMRKLEQQALAVLMRPVFRQTRRGKGAQECRELCCKHWML